MQMGQGEGMTLTVPIAITGMHRSGTSMITRALHDSGLNLVGTGAEEFIEAAEDNPEGFWENKAIRDCNDDLLEATGGAWDNPPALPPVAADDPRVAHLAEASAAALAALRQHDQWGFKDPRACLTAAYWLDLEPELRFVICVRHPIEVALSLKRRNQNSYSLGLALWERYYAVVLDQVPAERRIVTHYDTFFVDPEGEMARLCAFGGLDPVAPQVRRDLRHHVTDVGLGDAGVSAGVRSLYALLCKEAGAPQPQEAPADEGRVRRLILDGAVAQRQADQRQAAIDRLQEREDQFRADHANAEQAFRDKVRHMEAQVAAARLAALESETVAQLAALRESVARIEEQRHAGVRSVPDVVSRAARATARRLPARAQQSLRRGRRLAQRAVAEPGPTARIVTQRVALEVGAQATRLPPPAQRVARRGRGAYRRAAAAPAPTAKALVHRLPDPAERLARRAWSALAPVRRTMARRASGPGPRPGRIPKGPPPRVWKHRYGRMVSAAWSNDDRWLVATPGSPGDVRDARSPRGTRFPDTRGGRPLADDLSHIANLEARRYAGFRHLVVPEGSRPWFHQQVELRDHVVRNYGTSNDEPGAGMVFDLRAAPEPGGGPLRAAIDELTAGLDRPPAVLDWTGVALGAELPDLAVFAPPAGDRLPYLDRSIDVVVVDAGVDRQEAQRVAALGVITVEAGTTGPVVRSVEPVSAIAEPASPRVVVWSSPAPDRRWEAALGERAEQSGATLLLAPIDATGVGRLPDHDVVVAVEPYALPLPGTIRAAAAAASADPAAAVAGKVLRADGRLEGAGGTVFFDRSVALVAAFAADVRAPWHDYVRPVCWAPGLVAAAASLWTGVAGPRALEGRAYLREWCAALWSQGAAVVYHPDVVAVRVDGDGGEPSIPLEASAWQRVLDLRPPRPADLSDGAWRYLLDHDDLEACRG
jgi:Sulfotransferase family